MPFRSPLIEAAAALGAPVVSMALTYSGPGAAAIPYYGEMKFGSHLRALFIAPATQAELRVLSVIRSRCRKDLTQQAFEDIHRALAPQLA